MILFAVAVGITVACAYYIHPLVDPVAKYFGVSEAEIGLAPALNQFALAIGIFLLLPLGDKISNRRLVVICVIAQLLCLLAIAFAPNFSIFLMAMSLLGFFTIGPYIIPAFVSKRVSQDRLGEVTGILTIGVMLGILFARIAAGFFGEYFGWRSIYFVSAALMLITAITMPLIMRDEVSSNIAAQSPKIGYFALLASLFSLALRHKDMLLSAIIQALNFGIFLIVWLAIGFHLPSEEMGYGVDTVGYLAILSFFSLFTTVPLGKWADKVGPQRARLVVAIIQFCAIFSLPFVGYNLWLLIPALILTNIFGPIVDVTGRMTFLTQQPDIRTRLMTVYIVFMFAGGGLASWAGTSIYEWGGWNAASILAICVSIIVVTLSFTAWIRNRNGRHRES